MSDKTLSFFTSNDDDDESDSDSEQESDLQEGEENRICENHSEGCLPPPLTALAQAKTPEFVTSHIKADMDWNKMAKAAPYVPPKEYKPWEATLPSVETKATTKSKKPDLALVKGIPPSIAAVPPVAEPKNDVVTKTVDHAVAWSKMYKDFGFDSNSAKRPRPEDEDADLAGFCHTDVDAGKVAFQSKHLKTDGGNPLTFKEKEKRKRDTGKANRDKSFVEEEKRILRQGFDDN